MTTTAIFGPPGTGKTTELLRLVAEILGTTEDMAVVSFSKAAAQEIAQRPITGPNRNKKPVFVGTIHSFCFAELQLSRAQVVSPDILVQFAWDLFPSIAPPDVQKAIEIGQMANRRGMHISDAYTDMSDAIMPEDTVRMIWDTYEKWKATTGHVDFDDMIKNAVGRTKKFEHVIVDEAQDLSSAQWRMVRSMVKPGGQMIVAGDDDQAIFTWAGAYPHGMVDYSNTRRVLSQSYRIPRTVHDLARRVIQRVTKRHHKEYKPTNVKGYVSFAGEYIPTMYPYKHTVMVRDRYILKSIEEELIRIQMPYTIEGAHGPGLFTGKKMKLARAIMNKDVETVAKLKYMMPKHVAVDAEMGHIPMLAVALPLLNDEEYSYLIRMHKKDPNDVHVTLSTIHAQKGKEFDHGVIVAQCSPKVESMQERTMDFEDEVRVWYTALTRVRKGVTICGTNPYISV